MSVATNNSVSAFYSEKKGDSLNKPSSNSSYVQKENMTNISNVTTSKYCDDKMKWVYGFSAGQADGDSTMKTLLGGKGAGLATMSHLSLPVPPGFTITTSVCKYFNKNNGNYPQGLSNEVEQHVKKLETISGFKFGDEKRPLLLSVRSGAAISMPGMMDTILNLGLNDKTVIGLQRMTGNNKKFALDSYRRFIQMFSNVVMGIDINKFEEKLNEYKEKNNCRNDIDLSEDNLNNLLLEYKIIFKRETGIDFIQDINQQLWLSINAVFKSWDNERAKVYRNLNNISHDLGTAVSIQCMVFGNMNEKSATGVLFTRNPSTGKKELYGEYLKNAQGEDVVAGIRTPSNIHEMKNDNELKDMYEQILKNASILENYFHHAQDIEFTVQEKTLYILQTRNAKTSAKASIKINVDMVKEGLITKEDAICRIDPKSISQLLHPTLDKKSIKNVLTKGLASSPGAGCGVISLSAVRAEEMFQSGKDVILCTEDTNADDVKGMAVSKGVLTKRGGMTSHAAVVARGMGTPAVTGASEINIDRTNKRIKIRDVELNEGDEITIDGSTGEVRKGRMKTVDPELSPEFEQLMKWADEIKTLCVLANAETPKDASKARLFGARGIGLCRTEHMFFDSSRIIIMREMILAHSNEDRQYALNKLLPYQIRDFEELFEIMRGYPVTIRFLDPPLHEFLPEKEEDIESIIKAMDGKVTKEEIMKKLKVMKEVNPMLGLRGCRVGLLYPDINSMQTKAIIQAAINVMNRLGDEQIQVGLMVPFISTEEEIKIIKEQIAEITEKLLKENHVKKGKINYKVGTMIELPRAALKAGDIAKHAEFFSFGTNDLTQTCFGLSRDDSNSFINQYKKLNVIEKDPFVSLDQDGVGELIKIAVNRGIAERVDLKLSLCGEQGGDPETVSFCNKIGLHSVSCSPFLVPVARLAAAQATLRNQ